MGREDDILEAIGDMNGFEFQKLARRLLQREIYPNLNPLPDQNDLGQDARTEELPVTELPDVEVDGRQITFAMSKTDEKSKLKKDCNRCQEIGHDIDTLIFVTSGEVTNSVQKDWKEFVQEKYGWDLIVYERTWFADISTKPEHEKLIEEIFGIPPLNGDYYEDILEQFRKVTEKSLSNIDGTIPHIEERIARSEASEIASDLKKGENKILAGPAGVGKTGMLEQVIDRVQLDNLLFIDARRFSECKSKGDLKQHFNLNGSIVDAISRVGAYEDCLLVIDQLDNIGGTPTAGVFSELLTELEHKQGVSILVTCREWELNNRREYEFLTNQNTKFDLVEVSEIPVEDVERILSELDIDDFSDRLVNLGCNLLNLSIIADIQNMVDSSDVDVSKIKSQVELWEIYRSTLIERESVGGEWDNSGKEVHARAVELAEIGLHKNSRIFGISRHPKRTDKRLMSRGVIVNEFGKRYRFRHEELQDYFYADDIVNRLGVTKPSQILENIDQHAAVGVFRWMLRINIREGRGPAIREFFRDGFSRDNLGYYAACSVIDEVISWNPERVEYKLLDFVIDEIEERNELSSYFYENLSSPEWLPVLKQQRRLDRPSHSSLSYLDKVAKEVPNEFIEVVKSTKVEEGRKRAILVEIAGNLPLRYAKDVSDKLQVWIRDSGPSYSVHYSEFITSLIEKDGEGTALDLLDSLLKPQEPNTKEYQIGEGKRKFNTEATALADIYTIEKAIDQTIENLSDSSEKRLIEILEENLEDAITLEADEKQNSVEEERWPAEIERSDLQISNLKELLLEKLRGRLNVWIEENPEDDARELLIRYLNHDILLFRRLGLYLVSQCPHGYKELAKDILLNEEKYKESFIRSEFSLVLKNGFSTLEDQNQKEVAEIIDKGIEAEELEERASLIKEDSAEDSIDEIANRLNDSWKLRHFWLIRDKVPSEYRTQVDDLIEEYGELDDPVRKVKTETGVMSFKGPMKEEELRMLEPRELLELCVDWTPNEREDDSFTEISPEGLGEDLRSIIADSPEEFMKNFDVLSDADSIYLFYALDGLRESLSEGENLGEWGNVLSVCAEVVERTDSWSREASRVTGDFLGKCIRDTDLLESHADEVKQILLDLSEHPNPGLNEDDEFIAHERPITTAINSVRPTAIISLVSYSLKKAKLEGFQGYDKEQESGLDPDILQVLEERLRDPSTAVHSVYGQKILNLRWLDEEFVKENIDVIFPTEGDKESRERFAAAWSAYLSANKWNPGSYNWLRDYYFHAIELDRTEDKFKNHNGGRALVVHSLCSYLIQDETLNDNDSLIAYFYSNITPERASSASWQIWKWGNSDTSFEVEWEKVRSLWSWRLNSFAGDKEAYGQEFMWFVEWLDLKQEQLDPTDMENLLIETMPFISQESRSWDTIEKYLLEHIDDHPLTCIAVYNELVTQQKWPEFRPVTDKTNILLEKALQSGGDPKEIAINTAEELAKDNSDYLDLIREYNMD